MYFCEQLLSMYLWKIILKHPYIYIYIYIHTQLLTLSLTLPTPPFQLEKVKKNILVYKQWNDVYRVTGNLLSFAIYWFWFVEPKFNIQLVGNAINLL